MNVPTASAAIACLALASCDTFNRPINGSGFDPLRSPGSDMSQPTITPTTTYKAGQFVRAALPNTAFYKDRPKGTADADKLLAQGTSMKVISTSDSYLKVELDSGEVGFVPMVMVEDPNAPTGLPYGMNPGEVQVYPPVGGYGEPLPPITPGEMPPDGAIPTVIDPDAPAPQVPVPPVSTPGDEFTAPPVPADPNPGPAPLPPNDEDLQRMREDAAGAQPSIPETDTGADPGAEGE